MSKLKAQSLKIQSLSLQLPDGIYLCRDLSFSIEPGSTLALMGHSGSGKSSILNWITGTLNQFAQRRFGRHGTPRPSYAEWRAARAGQFVANLVVQPTCVTA